MTIETLLAIYLYAGVGVAVYVLASVPAAGVVAILHAKGSPALWDSKIALPVLAPLVLVAVPTLALIGWVMDRESRA